MNIIICVDDEGGISFNGRRQSQDKELIKKICEMTKGKKLWVSHYTEALFSDCEKYNISVDDNPLNKAAEGEYCFVECTETARYEDRIQKIILVKWNRKYPSDIRFDLNMSMYQLEFTEDITGKSHDKITLEVYKREI